MNEHIDIRRLGRQPRPIEDVRAEMRAEPVHPEWCLRQWCTIQPMLIDGEVWAWRGHHVAEQRAVAIRYGTTAETGVTVLLTEGGRLDVLLRLSSRDNGDSYETFCTAEEAEALAADLQRAACSLRFMQESA